MHAQPDRQAIVLTGATGYIGSLLAAALLEEGTPLVLPVRDGHTRQSVLGLLQPEVSVLGCNGDSGWAERIHVVPLADLDGLDRLGRRLAVQEVIHCAGSVDYFNQDLLRQSNIELTATVLKVAKGWNVRRFVYLSTAFSSGYLDREVPEELHGEPDRDPTEYTRTKRAAEWLVHKSGLPYLILRPSIVIGDSRDGHYSGKNYGLYQLWRACERFLCKEWQEVFHLVAPRVPLHLLHQDDLQRAFHAARRMLPDGTIVNVVSRHQTLPTMRHLWDQWVERCFRPAEVHYYARVAQVPHRQLHRCQRALLALASVNLEIGSHAWCFLRENLTRLEVQGLLLHQATVESVTHCLDAFMRESVAVSRFSADNRQHFPPARTVVEHYGDDPVRYLVAQNEG
jgi:nucleoside-diphosphate-sugar epimerase